MKKMSNRKGFNTDFAPFKKLVKMRYVDNVSLNPSAGSLAEYAFRANSVFDPDSTGVGHQPAYYDQASAMYNHYRVISAACTATFYNNGPVDTEGIACIVKLDDDGTLSPLLTDVLEDESGLTWGPLRTSATEDVRILKLNFNSDSFFGDKIDGTTAEFGVNPIDMAYFTVAIGPMDMNADIGPFGVLVEIDYMVECTERKDLVPSSVRQQRGRGVVAPTRVPPVVKTGDRDTSFRK